MSDKDIKAFRALAIRMEATREGGAVKRCHIRRTIDQYNNAQHSYGAVSLLLLLHPSPSLNLVKALQWHDVVERWKGDVPATAKWDDPEFAKVYEAGEERALVALGLLPDLSPEELRWVRAIDSMELWLWCREELHLGNQGVLQIQRRIELSLMKRIESRMVPEAVGEFFLFLFGETYKELPDSLSEVLTWYRANTVE